MLAGNVGQNNYNATFGCKRFADAMMEKIYQDGLRKMAKKSGNVSQEQIQEMKTAAGFSRLDGFISKKEAPISPQEFDKIVMGDPVAYARQCRGLHSIVNSECASKITLGNIIKSLFKK